MPRTDTIQTDRKLEPRIVPRVRTQVPCLAQKPTLRDRPVEINRIQRILQHREIAATHVLVYSPNTVRKRIETLSPFFVAYESGKSSGKLTGTLKYVGWIALILIAIFAVALLCGK